MTSPSSDYNLSSIKGIPSDIPATEGYSLSIYRLFEVFCPFVVGGILFLAASLKAFSLFSEPVLGSPWPQVFLIEQELALGLALWLKVWPHVIRWVALAVFGGFMGTALSFALAGARSCACFGKVPLHPWLAVLLDLGMLACLIYWKPQPSGKVASGVFCPRYGTIAAFVAMLVFPLALLGFGPSISFPLLEVSPAVVDLGTVKQGDRHTFALRVRNPHDQPVAVHHLQSSCPCLEGQGLPWRLEAGEERIIQLTLALDKEPDFVGRLLIDFRGQTDTLGMALAAQAQVNVVSVNAFAAGSP